MQTSLAAAHLQAFPHPLARLNPIKDSQMAGVRNNLSYVVVNELVHDGLLPIINGFRKTLHLSPLRMGDRGAHALSLQKVSTCPCLHGQEGGWLLVCWLGIRQAMWCFSRHSMLVKHALKWCLMPHVQDIEDVMALHGGCFHLNTQCCLLTNHPSLCARCRCCPQVSCGFKRCVCSGALCILLEPSSGAQTTGLV